MTQPDRLRSEKLIDALEKAFFRRGLTIAETAKGAGIHPNTLRGFARQRAVRSKTKPRTWNPQLTTIHKLERFLLRRQSTTRPISTES